MKFDILIVICLGVGLFGLSYLELSRLPASGYLFFPHLGKCSTIISLNKISAPFYVFFF